MLHFRFLFRSYKNCFSNFSANPRYNRLFVTLTLHIIVVPSRRFLCHWQRAAPSCFQSSAARGLNSGTREKISAKTVKTTRKTGGLLLAKSPWYLQTPQGAAFTVFKLPCIILLYVPKGTLWFKTDLRTLSRLVCQLLGHAVPARGYTSQS